MRVLVVSAHPDDETIGAGGTIARHVSEGDEVYWCIVTQGYNPPLSDEFLEATAQQVEAVRRVYGIRKVFRCGFPTIKLNIVPHRDLTSAIQRVVDETGPHTVYTTPPCDVNVDHRLVFEATLVATRPLPGCSVRRVLAYEIGTTSSYGVGSFSPNVYTDISSFIGRKLEAMACYQTELHEYPHPRSLKGLEMIARERGLSVGLDAAECFQLIRQVE